VRTLTLLPLLVLAARPVAAAESLSLSPAVVPLAGRFGQSTTQTLTLTNHTSQGLAFRLAAKDVVLVDGRRSFVDPFELPDSIAASAVFTAREVAVPPGESRSVDVTVTLPHQAAHRAVVILFEGATPVPQGRTVTRLSLGTLLTFTVSGNVVLDAADLAIEPPSPTRNLAFALAFRNDGSEPLHARGVAIVLGADGAVVGRAVFDGRRLLPGEHTRVRTEYAGDLAPGVYRALATFDYEGRTLTRTAEFTVR